MSHFNNVGFARFPEILAERYHEDLAATNRIPGMACCRYCNTFGTTCDARVAKMSTRPTVYCYRHDIIYLLEINANDVPLLVANSIGAFAEGLALEQSRC